MTLANSRCLSKELVTFSKSSLKGIASTKNLETITLSYDPFPQALFLFELTFSSGTPTSMAIPAEPISGHGNLSFLIFNG